MVYGTIVQLSDHFFQAYLHVHKHHKTGTDENNMKIKMWTVLLTTIRKARNHCQDEDHCQYHLGIDYDCQDRDPVRVEMSMQMIKTSGLP